MARQRSRGGRGFCCPFTPTSEAVSRVTTGNRLSEASRQIGLVDFSYTAPSFIGSRDANLSDAQEGRGGGREGGIRRRGGDTHRREKCIYKKKKKKEKDINARVAEREREKVGKNGGDVGRQGMRSACVFVVYLYER